LKTPEELLREFADNPAGLVDYTFQLQEQLRQLRQQAAQTEQELQEKTQHLAQAKEELEQKTQQLAQAQGIIAELKRELFGAKADKLNEEQEEQLRQLIGDVQEQSQRPPPVSQEVLQETMAQERADQRQRAKERTRRQLPPVELEKRQTILEPDDRICPTSGQERKRIGQEVTTEYDYIPAKLIIHEIVRPKYGSCERPCCQGVTIAPLPPLAPANGAMGGKGGALAPGDLLADLGRA
jgi:DNA repair exonuclease SbcCD ATPase subunit